MNTLERISSTIFLISFILSCHATYQPSYLPQSPTQQQTTSSTWKQAVPSQQRTVKPITQTQQKMAGVTPSYLPQQPKTPIRTTHLQEQLATTELPPAPPQQQLSAKKTYSERYLPQNITRPEDALTYKQEHPFIAGAKHKQYETQQAKATQKIHIPLVILSDFYGQESPKDKVFEPLGKTLRDNIQQKVAPLLVSQAILYNFIYRYHEYKNQNPQFVQNFSTGFVFSARDWSIYYQAETGLFLVFPVQLLSRYGRYFNLPGLFNNIKQLKTQTDDFSDQLDFLNPMNKNINPKHSNAIAFYVQTFLKEKISSAIWDIFIMGHGQTGNTICDLKPQAMQQLLKYFNDFHSIGIFIAMSCYIGGTNLNFFKFKNTVQGNQSITLGFPIIAIGTENASVIYEPLDYRKIFTYAANIGISKDSNLKSLLSFFGKTVTRSNIPQLILPGGIEIQSLTPDDSIEIIGKVKAQAAALEKRDLVINNKNIILCYPQVISIGLHINPKIRKLIERQMPHLLRPIDFTIGLSVPSLNDPRFPLLSNPQNSNRFNQINNTLIKKFESLPKNQQLQAYAVPTYPGFISMAHGDTTTFIQSIIVEKAQSLPESFLGVLTAIRDLFLDIAPTTKGSKTFLIESLTGPNDLGIQFELDRVQNITSNKPYDNALEKFLIDNNITAVDIPITLEQVIIIVSINKVSITFKIQNTNSAWTFEFNPSSNIHNLYWSFKRIDASILKAQFTQLQSSSGIQSKESGVEYGALSLTDLIQMIQIRQIIDTDFWQNALLQTYNAKQSNDQNVKDMGDQLSKIIVDKATQIIVRSKEFQQLIEDQQRFQLILLIAEEALNNKQINLFSVLKTKLASLCASNSSRWIAQYKQLLQVGIQQAIAIVNSNKDTTNPIIRNFIQALLTQLIQTIDQNKEQLKDEAIKLMQLEAEIQKITAQNQLLAVIFDDLKKFIEASSPWSAGIRPSAPRTQTRPLPQAPVTRQQPSSAPRRPLPQPPQQSSVQTASKAQQWSAGIRPSSPPTRTPPSPTTKPSTTTTTPSAPIMPPQDRDLSWINKKLCVYNINTNKWTDGEDCCPICLEDDSYEKGKRVIIPNCRHVFCENCYKKISKNKECPICRQDISSGTVTKLVP